MTRADRQIAYRELDSRVKKLVDYCRESTPGDARGQLEDILTTYASIEFIVFEKLFRTPRSRETINNIRIYCNACVCQIEASKEIQRRCRILGIECQPYPIETYCTLLVGTICSMPEHHLSNFFGMMSEQHKRVEFWRVFDAREEYLLSLQRSLYEYRNIKTETRGKHEKFPLDLTYPIQEVLQAISDAFEQMYILTSVFKRYLFDRTTDVTELSRVMEYERPLDSPSQTDLFSTTDAM